MSISKKNGLKRRRKDNRNLKCLILLEHKLCYFVKFWFVNCLFGTCPTQPHNQIQIWFPLRCKWIRSIAASWKGKSNQWNRKWMLLRKNLVSSLKKITYNSNNKLWLLPESVAYASICLQITKSGPGGVGTKGRGKTVFLLPVPSGPIQWGQLAVTAQLSRLPSQSHLQQESVNSCRTL